MANPTEVANANARSQQISGTRQRRRADAGAGRRRESVPWNVLHVVFAHHVCRSHSTWRRLSQLSGPTSRHKTWYIAQSNTRSDGAHRQARHGDTPPITALTNTNTSTDTSVQLDGSTIAIVVVMTLVQVLLGSRVDHPGLLLGVFAGLGNGTPGLHRPELVAIRERVQVGNAHLQLSTGSAIFRL